MEPTEKPYTGKPFVGIVTHRIGPEDKGRRDYCLLIPTTEKEIGGASYIPMEEQKGEFSIGGIEALARALTYRYGETYEEQVTFEPPESRRVGRPGHWVIQTYERLEEEDREALAKAIREWQRLHPGAETYDQVLERILNMRT